MIVTITNPYTTGLLTDLDTDTKKVYHHWKDGRRHDERDSNTRWKSKATWQNWMYNLETLKLMHLIADPDYIMDEGL